MIWCIFSMIAGAAIFCAGALFERGFEGGNKEKTVSSQSIAELPRETLAQWENLLNYDGNEQEESENE